MISPRTHRIVMAYEWGEGKRRYACLTLAPDVVSFQLHAAVALPRVKQPSAQMEQEAG